MPGAGPGVARSRLASLTPRLPPRDPGRTQRDPCGTRKDPTGPIGTYRDLIGTSLGPGLDPVPFHENSSPNLQPAPAKTLTPNRAAGSLFLPQPGPVTTSYPKGNSKPRRASNAQDTLLFSDEADMNRPLLAL